MTDLDHRLLRWFLEHRTEPFDSIFVGLTRAGTSGALFLAIALAVALWRRRPALFVAVAVADGLAEGVVRALKPAIGRARPPLDPHLPAPLVPLPHDASFPSGHAATAFACAVVLAFAVPRLAPFLVLLAAAVAFSRVYVGVHYPADVVAGALLGSCVGGAVVLAARLLSGRGRRTRRAGRRGWRRPTRPG